jgi:serine/threonine protein kinase/Tol biopolymer transport system component
VIGSTVSHYEILERLGGGGMGVVYKARDLRLDRPVALKFLAVDGDASEEERKRFLREARAASVLDHPSICTLYEIDETADGRLFLAMAYCEGETLTRRIAQGPLPIAEAVDLALQIADGLAAAHAKGIIHRDVKPGNVVVTAGRRIKIVDFGIASLAGQSRLTRAGTALGTAAYMSPEQLRSEPADARADVWSLGVVLYEMLTGRLPFPGESERGIALAILTRTPEPLAALRPEVPAALERVVARTLAKRPEDRYPGMEALRADLRAAAASASAPAGAAGGTLRDLPTLARPSELPLPGGDLTGCVVDHYRVLERLGGGGMGVIYKAEDLRLSRSVALKLLPAELTRDAEAKARFLQEARAASALDHPNVCTILEVGETGEGRLYLAMPLYDGATLRRRIEGGPLPVAEAADIAAQIACGLAKAHRGGIVHRDIKPANVVVTTDGVVKILDFGLAKLAGEAAITRTGASLGTPAYMSPEQARGEAVDHRADLWSLGVVLYEMLAGRRPFRGEREQAVIYAILHEEPQRLSTLRADAPAELERIVARLLAKDPEERFPSAEALLAELRALHGEPPTGTALRRRPEETRRGARPWIWAAAAAAAALAGLGGFLLRPGDESMVPQFQRLTTQQGRELFPSLSPDGDELAYVKATSPGNLDIYLQRVGGGNPRNLTADSGLDDTQPAFSPDGQRIAFRSERDGGGIFVMGATGESVRRLTEFGYNPAWSPDGSEVLVATQAVTDPISRASQSQIWRVSLATGEKRRVPTPEDAVQPSWSPNGHRIAYWGLPSGRAQRVLWTSPAAGGEAVPVTDDFHINWNPVWSPDGRYLYFASDRGGSMNLWRVPIDEGSGKVLGRPEPVPTPAPWSGFITLSRSGSRIAFATDEGTVNIERFPFDPVARKVSGPAVPITQGAQNIRFCQVSPDGRWVAFHSTGSREDLFVVGADGGGLRQIIDDDAKDRYPQWSPDGSRLLFQSNRSGRYEAWTIRPDGSDLRQLTRTRGEALAFPVWSPDGRRLACTVISRGSAVVDLREPLGRRTPRLLPTVEGSSGELFSVSSWSPDGSQLAGTLYRRDHEAGLFLYTFSSQRYERLIPRGRDPLWLPDGQSLLYTDEGRILLFDLRARVSSPVLEPAASSRFLSASPSRDGRFLFALRANEEGNIGMLTLP